MNDRPCGILTYVTDVYFKVIFEMPTYSDSYTVRKFSLAMDKYNFLIAENKKFPDYYKNVRIEKIEETRNSMVVYPEA